MFADYVSNNPRLWDGIKIDRDTIYQLMEEFSLYYVFTADFYFNFRKKLKQHLPFFYSIKWVELENELFNLSTNLRFRNYMKKYIGQNMENRFANDTGSNVGSDFNHQNAKNDTSDTRDENGNTTGSSTGSDSRTRSETENTEKTTDTHSQNASRVAPQSIIGTGNFDNLFNWETATNIEESIGDTEEKGKRTFTGSEQGTNQNNTNGTSHNIINDILNNKMEQDSYGTYNQSTFKQSVNNLHNISQNLDAYITRDKELNQQAVKSINNIIDYLWKDNKSFDYLREKLKGCFVNIY